MRYTFPRLRLPAVRGVRAAEEMNEVLRDAPRFVVEGFPSAHRWSNDGDDPAVRHADDSGVRLSLILLTRLPAVVARVQEGAGHRRMREVRIPANVITEIAAS